MGKTCLLITSTKVGESIQVPVGLIYLGSQLKKHGYAVEIFHVTDKKRLQICKEKLISNNYLFAGFSVWMGSTSLDMIELSKEAKNRNIPTIWGGKFVTSLKADTLTENSVDIAVMGYAEETIVELADCFRLGKDLSTVSGIYFRDRSGTVVKTKDRQVPDIDLDNYEYDLSLISDWSLYIVKPESEMIIFDPLESQRGCLFRCRFCFHSDDTIYSRSAKKIVNFHSVDFIINEAKELKALTGVKKISFCDDEFWISENRSLEIIQQLKDIGIEIILIRIRFTSLNENMLEKLEALSVSSIACGLESGNARILKMMNKGLTLDIVENKMRLLAKRSIIVNTVIIIGNPTETKHEMLDSIRFMLSLRKIKRNLNLLTFFYRPLPSTDFGKIAEECGFKRPKHVKEWVNVSAEHIFNIGHQWLPWYSQREKINMGRKDDYFILNSILAEQLYGAKANNLHVKLLWPLLYLAEKITFKRIYHWNFSFPIDAKIGLFIYGLYKFTKNNGCRLKMAVVSLSMTIYQSSLNFFIWLKLSLMCFVIYNRFFNIPGFAAQRAYYLQPGIKNFWKSYPNRKEAKARVVIYSLRTYERNDLIVFEKVLSDALRYNGANVLNLLCENFLTSCDGAPYPKSHKPLCVYCRFQRKHFYELYPNNFIRMSDYLTKEDYANAKKAVDALDPFKLKDYEFLGVKVGEHGFSSAIKYFRNRVQDYKDSRFLEALRHNVFQGVLLVLVAKGILEIEKPTHFVTLHGGYATWGPISDYLGAHGVSIYLHNKSVYRVGCFYITKAGQYIADIIAKEIWEEQKSLVLTEEQKSRLCNHLNSVKQGSTTEYKVYDSIKRRDPDTRLMKLLKSEGRKKFALYPHMFWDKAFINRYDSLGSFFSNDIEWMLETIKFFVDKKDCLLFVKPHPGENMMADLTEFGAEKLIRDRLGTLPDHIVIIDRKCRIKSFDLMDNDCIGIVFTSVSGLEHNFFKKPVLVAGEIHYARAGAALRIKSKEEYFSLLDSPRSLYDFIEHNYSTIERYAYYYYFRQQVRIPFYKDNVWLRHCIDWKILSDYRHFIASDKTMNSIAKAIIEGGHVMSID